ncbi:hypothetical protein D3C86_1280950 [compost metagenome]
MGGVETGRAHHLAHGLAGVVHVVEHAGVEGAGDRAAAQQRRLEAHALFLGKADHLDGEREALALAVPLGHAGNRQDHAEVAVVAAGIAHGVEVGAGEQRGGVRRGAFVAADDVAGGVAAHGHAGFAHPFGQLRGGAVVGVGQIGAGQQPGLLGVDGQGVGPGHDAGAGLRGQGRRGCCRGHCHSGSPAIYM